MALGNDRNQPLLSVTAPVFNEEDNIERVLTYWDEVFKSAEIDGEIVITNDGSTDKTAGILQGLQEKIPRLRVVAHKQNGGYGRALSSAIRNSCGQWVVTIDSDGQFDLKDSIPLLTQALAEDLDGVTGYRGKKQDTLFRVFADRALNVIVRALFGIKYRDTNCALKVVKGDFLRQVNIEARGYPAPTETLIKLNRLGARIGEGRVTHLERVGGLSKLKPFQTSINFLKFLVYLKFKIYLYRTKVIHSL